MKILESEPHYPKRRVPEAIWKNTTPQTSNLDYGLALNDINFGQHISTCPPSIVSLFLFFFFFY